MSRFKPIFNIILALILSFSLLATSTGSVLAGQNKPLRIDPDFLKLVQAYPDALYKVIVQKDAKNKDLKAMELEYVVQNGGGQVRKQLGMIVSFSAEMTGKQIERLAKNPKVLWISPDAPVVSTALKPGSYTYRDEFTTRSYQNSKGTQNWSATPWVEIGESDGDKDFPTICGTGTEDYFCGSYDFEDQETHLYVPFSTPYTGLHQVILPDKLYRSQFRFGMYRFHVMDPIRFESDLRVTIQALGWRSGMRYLPLQDDLASVAFWYQTLPAAPFPSLPEKDYLEVI